MKPHSYMSKEEEKEWDALEITPSATTIIKLFEENPNQLIPLNDSLKVSAYSLNTSFTSKVVWLKKINGEYHLKLTKKGKKALELMEV